MEVALVPPELREQRFHTVQAVHEGPNGALVSFSAVHGLDAASALVGRSVLVRQENLPRDFALLDREGLLGREVVDGRLGALGRVCEVFVGPTQDVWVLEGAQGSVQVPIVREFVRAMPEEGPLELELPEGMLETTWAEGGPA
jgi:16S rRNA processing protein RimM